MSISGSEKAATEESSCQPRREGGVAVADGGRNNNKDGSHSAPEEEWLFSCRCESAKAVATLLNCLRSVAGGDVEDKSATSKKGRKLQSLQPVTVYCNQSNITFQVFGMARQSQASVEMQAGLFSDYKLFSESSDFCVNLRVVMECLHVLGLQSLERTKLSMSYNLREEIFKLELLEEGVLSTAAIPGILPPDDSGISLTHAFRSSPVVARLIVKSEPFCAALHELELCVGASTCSVALGPQGLRLTTVGSMSECAVSLPVGATSTIVNLEAPDDCAQNYPLQSFLSGMKALDFADETCVSINASGLIAIQHQILDPIGQGAPNFADFIMAPLVEEDGEEDDEERPSASKSARPVSNERDNSNGDGDDTKPTTTSKQHPSRRLSLSAPKQTGAESQESDGEGGDDDDGPHSSSSSSSSSSPQLFFGALPTNYRTRQQRKRRIIAEEDEDSDESRSLLVGDEDEAEEFDITAGAPSTPPRRARASDDEDTVSSSPELVYK